MCLLILKKRSCYSGTKLFPRYHPDSLPKKRTFPSVSSIVSRDILIKQPSLHISKGFHQAPSLWCLRIWQVLYLHFHRCRFSLWWLLAPHLWFIIPYFSKSWQSFDHCSGENHDFLNGYDLTISPWIIKWMISLSVLRIPSRAMVLKARIVSSTFFATNPSPQ